jgi:ribosomal protein S19
MQKPAILLFISICLLSTARSQSVTAKRTVINDSLTSSFYNSSARLPFFSSSADGEKIVASIMDVMGLDCKFKIKEAKVPNVEATIKHHERYILFNPGFINQVNTVTKNKWANIFVLAHEIGHHLDGHTEAGMRSSPAIELEADQFAGFVLHKMGATLEQSQLAMYYISNIQASKTHPGRADRLEAIEKGWNKAETQKD